MLRVRGWGRIGGVGEKEGTRGGEGEQQYFTVPLLHSVRHSVRQC